MKKTYQSPATMTVAVAVTHHLTENTVTVSGKQATVNSSGDYNTLSRQGGSNWDNED